MILTGNNTINDIQLIAEYPSIANILKKEINIIALPNSHLLANCRC
jgi:hypothetical protein